MKVVIQRSKESSVIVDNTCVSKIDKGLVVLACFTEGDSEADKSMKHDEANAMFEKFTKKLSERIPTYTGVFGADMTLNITNDGPVTIIIDTENK